MDSTMMVYPLTLTHILERAGKIFPRVEVVSQLPGKSLHRYAYGDLYTHHSTPLRLKRKLQNPGVPP